MDNFLLRACNALDKYKGFASTQGARLDTQDVSLNSWPWRSGRDQHGAQPAEQISGVCSFAKICSLTNLI